MDTTGNKRHVVCSCFMQQAPYPACTACNRPHTRHTLAAAGLKPCMNCLQQVSYPACTACDRSHTRHALPAKVSHPACTACNRPQPGMHCLQQASHPACTACNRPHIRHALPARDLTIRHALCIGLTDIFINKNEFSSQSQLK